MQENSFESNSEVLNSNNEVQNKAFLIKSQEELVKYLKNAHEHGGSYAYFGLWGKYLIFSDNNNCTITGVRLADMLYDGVIAPGAINNLDEILQYKDAIADFENLSRFLYWFYGKDLKAANYNDGLNFVMRRKTGFGFAEASELKNAVNAFNTEKLKANPTKYIIDLSAQKDSLKKENYTPEDPLENYLLPYSVGNINGLLDLLPKSTKIPWNKLRFALRENSVKDINTLFDICDTEGRRDIVRSNWCFIIFKKGAFKDFDWNDKQILKECGLIKKSPLLYPWYMLLDIGRIIIFPFVHWFGYCNNKWFCNTKNLYRDNCDVDSAITRIKNNQKAKPVDEKPPLLDNIQILDNIQNQTKENAQSQNPRMEGQNINRDNIDNSQGQI